ncbi:Methylthioribose-1-phosphate isomerase [Mycena indigotica]|uniref:Methylthioribose-1-phosphate isomerase n=1 Tax=Mycena indigotica TaxID=2126181 RepID=A0A8H6WK97_9AGAR|nr:Methylthioribose-1-phosphate isomerase [Mycena indigotica]KAF7315504.1 Methylthioribose-1-phosphate isomerase [Mycena indigotica]
MAPTALVSILTDPLRIVNQLLLPHTTEYVQIDTIEQAHEAIRSMKIRGAPAIASLAALAFAAHISRGTDASASFTSSPDAVRAEVESILAFLYTARPTAVNLGAATRRLTATLNASHASGKDARTICEDLVAEAHKVADEDVGRNKAMAKWGGDWLLGRHGGENNLNVLTVCNTGSLATSVRRIWQGTIYVHVLGLSVVGTALGLITYLHETQKLGMAYYTQTAPYHQGSRLTALELQTLEIPSTMICDTMVGSLFQHYKIHAVAVGADRIAKNGDTANKIGTYNAAVLAARHNIPFIVVAPISTVDLSLADGSGRIPIEQRPPIEACLVRGAIYPADANSSQATVMITPPGLTGIYNPSFDVTPAELITAIVTEKGVATRQPGELTFDLSTVV